MHTIAAVLLSLALGASAAVAAPSASQAVASIETASNVVGGAVVTGQPWPSPAYPVVC